MSDYTTNGKGRNPMVKKLQPKLRFRGFTDAWELRRLKSLHRQPLLVSPVPSQTYISWSVPAFSTGEPEIVKGSEIESVKQSVNSSDVLLCRINPRINRVWVVEARKDTDLPMIASTEWVVFTGHNSDSYFLSALFTSSRFRNMLLSEVAGVTGSQKRFQIASVLERQEYFPTQIEQARIGLLFEKVDNLIAAEKRKLLLLEQKREAYSQKVFSYGSHHEEDVKHWKTMRLGDIATRITRRNKGQSNLPLTISARDGLIDQRQFFSKQVASKNLDNYILLQRGEFAYNKSTSSDSPWGTIKRLDRYDQGCISTLYICFSMHSVDPQFITTLFNSPIWHREIQTIATEGARNHGLLNISPKDFFDIQLQIPDSLSEQKHIGRFFAAYEQLIRQTAKRIGLLEKKKKALLQTMFI
ncbi:restriction endonuclease subunit S [Bifidobacterium pseudolongum]|uniref:restriction endonuclease subunit S n=1 Tax=Bifidobacterium pseudolongum TaxID=1694 RepID=UPI00101E942A|nr:restriction endonuclease subunit S [Bifidobacterium pseudolongum]